MEDFFFFLLKTTKQRHRFKFKYTVTNLQHSREALENFNIYRKVLWGNTDLWIFHF